MGVSNAVRRYGGVAAGVLTAVASGGVAGAEEAMQLPVMTIEAQALEETLPAELSRYGSRVEVIEREELDSTGHNDVGQALEMLVPGLHVAPKNGRADYVEASLLGSRTEDILWLVDGVRINNRLFPGTTPLDSLTTEMVERIEVLKGGQALFYGTQAVAGVVNIVLRDPQSDQAGAFSAGVGTFEARHVGGYVTDSGLGGEWLLFGDHGEEDGFQPFRDEAYEPNARKVDRGYDRTSVGGKYQRRFGSDRKLSLFLQRNDAKVDFARPYNNFKGFNDRDENILSLKWEHYFSEQAGYFIKAYWHDWWSRWTRLGMDTSGNVNVINDRDRWGYEDYGVNILGRYTMDGGSEWLVGVDYQKYWGEDFVLRIERQEETTTALFAQFRPYLSFSPDTRLAIGGRYNNAEFGGDSFIWDVTASHPLTRRLEVNGSVGTTFRLPSAFELFVVDPAFPAGNPDLDPEHSFNANASLKGRDFGPFAWEVAVFHREIEDLIAVRGGTFVNSEDKVRVLGTELMTGVRFSPSWQLEVSATYADATNQGNDQQIDEIPEYFAKVHLKWDQAEGPYGGRLSVLYSGKVFKTLSDVGRQQYGEYTKVDLSGYVRFGAKRRHRVTLRLENLLDEEYASQVSQGTRVDGTSYRYDDLGVPRNAQLRYRYAF